MDLKLSFPVVFSVIALLISAICGIAVNNRYGYIAGVSLFSVLLFAILGFAAYTILEKKVPEFLAFLRESFSGSSEGYGEEGAYSSSEGMGDAGASSSEGDGEYASATFAGKTAEPKKSGKFGDHIIIDNITIKNEPKIMAQAIRTIMAQDDDVQE